MFNKVAGLPQLLLPERELGNVFHKSNGGDGLHLLQLVVTNET